MSLTDAIEPLQRVFIVQYSWPSGAGIMHIGTEMRPDEVVSFLRSEFPHFKVNSILDDSGNIVWEGTR